MTETELQKAIVSEYNGGTDVKTLAKKYNKSASYIYRTLNSAGVKLEIGNYKAYDIMGYIIDNPDKSQSDVARDLGITRQRVHAVIQQFK